MVSTIEITPSQSAETFPVYDTVPLLPIYVPCYILCRRTMFFFFALRIWAVRLKMNFYVENFGLVAGLFLQ